jgi:hypothetical protein
MQLKLLTREDALGRIGHVQARELFVEWTGADSRFLVLHTAATEIIVVERRPTAPAKCSMLFLWQMNGKWVVSADVQNGTAEDVLAAIARRLP